jgi:hypothetical protein
VGDQVQLEAMPGPLELRRDVVGDEVVISYGGRVLCCYSTGDRGLRNLAIVSLTRAGVPGVEVAGLFGLRPEHVSRLRRLAEEGGSAGLLPVMGRPVKLDGAARRRVYALADLGRSGTEIALEMGVSASTVSRLLARRSGGRAQLELSVTAGDHSAAGGVDDVDDHHDSDDHGPVEKPDDKTSDDESIEESERRQQQQEEEEVVDSDRDSVWIQGEDRDDDDVSAVGRIEAATVSCGYAGAMLLHGFFDRAGASKVLASLPKGPARRYDTPALMLAGTFGFALGSSSAEGTKHLLSGDAGALIGVGRFPHLRTLRPRLAALAEQVDPLAVQVALAKAMLDGDDDPPEVFFVDDHFVAYSGSKPVPKGWNTRRRHAERGRDDTFITDRSWRAICFSSGPPSGLSSTMLDPLQALRTVIGERPAMIGFDRGGSYPAVFAELTRRGFDWVTYRRAPLVEIAAKPTRSWVAVDGARLYLNVADETVTLKHVGQVRQISVIDNGAVALQILTSDSVTAAARLARCLRDRWRIENTFKYLEDHHGIGWLCDYRADLAPDTTPVANPARKTAKAAFDAATAQVASAKSALGAAVHQDVSSVADHLEILRQLRDDLTIATDDLAEAKAALKGVPAKVPANSLDPDATRATLATNRRALQMVCRLLAYNAELDLARALNTYLGDPDEYRAITRHLLHQPGTITYTPTAITVAIRTPDAPRIARALVALLEQLNTNPPKLTGDSRPITYQIEPKP